VGRSRGGRRDGKRCVALGADVGAGGSAPRSPDPVSQGLPPRETREKARASSVRAARSRELRRQRLEAEDGEARRCELVEGDDSRSRSVKPGGVSLAVMQREREREEGEGCRVDGERKESVWVWGSTDVAFPLCAPRCDACWRVNSEDPCPI
jgi:hypothetical protein